MKGKVLLFDFGQGNLHSVEKALAATGADLLRVDSGEAMRAAEASARGFVLPGVGAFASAMRGLAERGLAEGVRDLARAALAGGRPFLGICIGLQILFESSEESPGAAGLGVFAGKVRRFSEGPLAVPQIGWNEVLPRQERNGSTAALAPFAPRGYAYFVHSFFAEPQDPAIRLAETRYGVSFASAVGRGNLLAVQFHPEKSSRRGLELLRRFFE